MANLKNIEVILKFQKETKTTVVYEIENEDEDFRSKSIYIGKGAFEDLNDVPEYIKLTIIEEQ